MASAPGLAGRPDRDLVLAFQAGDESAFDELYRRHHERVAKVCYRLTNNRADAEEAAQEAFMKAFQALPRFNGQYQVGAWLSRIATNVCVDHLRVKTRSHLVALPNDERLPETEAGPEDTLVGDHPEIDVAIGDIQPLHAHALRMRAVDGLSHVEIAGRLRMTPPQVKALLHRARTSFKKAWGKAQGWLLAPVIGTRAFDRSSHMTNNSSNLAVISAQAPALAQKAAASVLIVVAAMSGGAPTFSSRLPDAPPPEAPAEEMAQKQKAAQRPAAATRAPVDTDDAVATAPQPPQSTTEKLLAVPETLTSTIEGHNVDARDDDGDEGQSESNGETVPATVKESRKEAVDLVKETVTNLDE